MVTIVVTAVYPLFFLRYAAEGLSGEVAIFRHGIASTIGLAIMPNGTGAVQPHDRPHRIGSERHSVDHRVLRGRGITVAARERGGGAEGGERGGEGSRREMDCRFQIDNVQ